MKRLLLTDHIDTAMQSLRINRMRSVLTIIGIMIGVASITTILCLSGGVTAVVNKQVNAVGGDVAVIRPGTEQPSLLERFTQSVNTSQYNASTLTEADLDALRENEPNLAIAPIMTLQTSLRAGKTTLRDRTVLATTPELAETTSLPIDQGQFIDTTTSDNTAVIGAQLAVDLFGTNSPLGQSFSMRGQSFTIIGILKAYNNPFNYDGVDYDHAVVIDLNAGKILRQGQAQIQQFTVRAKSQSDLHTALPKLRSTLEKMHGEIDFIIIVGKDIAAPTNSLFTVLAGVMSAVAAISLVVGGIGIMNIMLVSVAERTREIGIRKAVGASNRNIVSQFVIESLILSLSGGFLGFTLGVVMAFIVGTQLYFTPVVTWQNAVIALATSVAIGIIFGLYPASKAARKDPIESLRQYR